MSHHDLKTWPENYATHDCGVSIRNNDRDFRNGDTVRFIERTRAGTETGRVSQHWMITGIISEHVGIKPGYVVLLLHGPWGSRVAA